jgi:hypothetical protein
MGFCELAGSPENPTKELFLPSQDDSTWIQRKLIKFIEFQKPRRLSKEKYYNQQVETITTLPNYFAICSDIVDVNADPFKQ